MRRTAAIYRSCNEIEVIDWVLAQIALVESCDAEMDEVFLPYLMDEDGNTLYQAYSNGRLLLGGTHDGN